MTDHLKELEDFCQAQIARLLSQNEKSSGISITNLDAPVSLVSAHAAGPKKPSLSELEMDDQEWKPRPRLRRNS